jgi:hypothetical protein
MPILSMSNNLLELYMLNMTRSYVICEHTYTMCNVLVSVSQKMATKKISLRLYPTNATYTELYFSSKFYTDVT